MCEAKGPWTGVRSSRTVLQIVGSVSFFKLIFRKFLTFFQMLNLAIKSTHYISTIGTVEDINQLNLFHYKNIDIKPVQHIGFKIHFEERVSIFIYKTSVQYFHYLGLCTHVNVEFIIMSFKYGFSIGEHDSRLNTTLQRYQDVTRYIHTTSYLDLSHMD